MGWRNDETGHWGLGMVCDNCAGSQPSTMARTLCQGGHCCVGALGRPGVSNPDLSLAVLPARAAISPSLLLTHFWSLSPADSFPSGIRPLRQPSIVFRGAARMCALPGDNLSSLRQPSCCHSLCDNPGPWWWHFGGPCRRTLLVPCSPASHVYVLGSPVAASFLPLASGALPAPLGCAH